MNAETLSQTQSKQHHPIPIPIDADRDELAAMNIDSHSTVSSEPAAEKLSSQTAPTDQDQVPLKSTLEQHHLDTSRSANEGMAKQHAQIDAPIDMLKSSDYIFDRDRYDIERSKGEGMIHHRCTRKEQI